MEHSHIVYNNEYKLETLGILSSYIFCLDVNVECKRKKIILLESDMRCDTIKTTDL